MKCSAPTTMIDFCKVGIRMCCHSSISSACENIDEHINSTFRNDVVIMMNKGHLGSLPKCCQGCIGKGGYKTHRIEDEFTLKEINVGNNHSCDLSCRGCPNTTGGVIEDDAERSKELLAILTRYRETIVKVNMLGGDPALNPDTPAILKLLRPDTEILWYHNGVRDKLCDGTKITDALSKFDKVTFVYTINGDLNTDKVVKGVEDDYNIVAVAQANYEALPTSRKKFNFLLTKDTINSFINSFDGMNVRMNVLGNEWSICFLRRPEEYSIYSLGFRERQNIRKIVGHKLVEYPQIVKALLLELKG